MNPTPWSGNDGPRTNTELQPEGIQAIPAQELPIPSTPAQRPRAERIDRALFHAVAEVGDGQFVSRSEPPQLHPPAVDPGPVGATQVEDHDLTADPGQAAMDPR